MVLIMDPFSKCIENLSKSKKLLDSESKNDPATEPYRSAYLARDLLLESKNMLVEDLKNIDATHPDFYLLQSLLSVILCQMGTIFLETNDVRKAEECMMDSLAAIDDHLHSDCVLASVHARNSLGYLWSHRAQYTEAKKWLEGAENLYKDFRSCKNKPVRRFQNISDEVITDEAEKELEGAHTMTKFYLAQVYEALKDFLKSAMYCHETLKRQLVYKEYDPIDWALNSVTLSQFFMDRFLFKQARHHLAAASYVLDTYEETLKDWQGSQEEIDTKKEELRQRSADVSRFWAKYGIFLLTHSKNILTGKIKEPSEEKNEQLENLWFDSLDLSVYENQIPDSEVIAFEDAREIFLITQKHLNKAKEYYTLEDRASHHVQLVQDHSQLFKNLMAFEPDEERQFKMMKKRVDMLEFILKELNPKYYMDVCRQLWFELGETYTDMMQIKHQQMKDSKQMPVPKTLMKINSLTENSILHFNNFLDSLKDKKSKELPDSLPEELLGPLLVAHFHLGRLYYKYITQDKRKIMENTTKAYEHLKYLVDNCEKNEKAKNIVEEELKISKDLMPLLHLKALQL